MAIEELRRNDAVAVLRTMEADAIVHVFHHQHVAQ